MADNEEDYIDISELKTEEQAIKTAKKENFKSKFKSTFKKVGDKSLTVAGKLGEKGGQMVKKGYDQYKASQTPEAKSKRYSMEMENIERQRKMVQAKSRLEKAKKSLPKQQNTMFGGGMGGDMFGGMGSPGKSSGSMGNPFGGGMPGLSKGKKRKSKEPRMYNPFG